MIENYLRERRLVIIIILEVTNTDQLKNFCVDEITGTIQRVAKRQAVRYMQRTTGRFIDYQLEYAQSILFENERESILDTYAYENRNCFVVVQPHAKLPEQVSSLVMDCGL
jgi:hypothetical protein